MERQWRWVMWCVLVAASIALGIAAIKLYVLSGERLTRLFLTYVSDSPAYLIHFLFRERPDVLAIVTAGVVLDSILLYLLWRMRKHRQRGFPIGEETQ